MAAAKAKNEQRVAALIVKKDMYLKNVDKLVEYMNEIESSDSAIAEEFLAASDEIETDINKFETIMDELVVLKLSLDPDSEIDYNTLAVYKNLAKKVKFFRNKLLKIHQEPTSSIQNSIKLPPINIPQFDGNLKNWPIFYESFKINIHLNKHLSDSQRMQYLISNLKDSALKIITGIIPTGDTYKIIWESLINKYQDVRVLGSFYLNNIFDIKNPGNNSSSLDSFIEQFSSSMAALKQLDIPDLADFVFLNCALRKLDTQLVQEFETSIKDIQIPSSTDFVKYIQSHVKVLERSYSHVRAYNSNTANKSSSSSKFGYNNNTQSRVFTSSTKSSPRICAFCNKDDHFIFQCKEFINSKSPLDRYNFVRLKRGCLNCLSMSHTVINCKSSYTCNVCKKFHHTLLHFENSRPYMSPNESRALVQASQSSDGDDSAQNASQSVFTDLGKTPKVADNIPVMDSSFSYNVSVKSDNAVLLATAQVYGKALNKHDSKVIVRCLIDNGSQNNLITVSCCNALNLDIIPLTNSHVKGVGLTSRPIIGYVYLVVQSRLDLKNEYKIHALVVDQITDNLPSFYINQSQMMELQNIPLADLTWNIPSQIDLIIGAQMFPYIYLGKKIELRDIPIAIETTFGYVLMGDIPNQPTNVSLPTFTGCVLGELVQKFWELEEISASKFLSPEETECENMYVSSLNREADGRYNVSLPFHTNPSQLGNSSMTAKKRLLSLERKFKENPEFKDKYINVIKEYIERGYLSIVSQEQISDEGYYIPHHAVVRVDKPAPRIVLDASAKTHTGLSLNDILHIGPNLQADLFMLLLDFRLFPVVLSADIKQMFMQIGANKEDRKYLRILFRFTADESIQTYQFNRVPFGLKASPYLAMRTIRQLAEDMRAIFPEAARVAESKLYMDDLVHSVPNVTEALNLSKDLISLFKSGCFDLVKWKSNSVNVIANLPESHREIINFPSENSVSKVLGLAWDPKEDVFLIKTEKIHEKCTKRNILSIVARFFDILGLVAPIVLYAKLLIKELWLCKIDWDEVPSENVVRRFHTMIQEFPLLTTLNVPRHIGVMQESRVNIVAFCDASMVGYGCVVYIHSKDLLGNINVMLLCAKSKVSPTKITTLARLELCAALLMSKLLKLVQDAYSKRIQDVRVYAFSDSMIALSWIKSSPHRWSVFVSNRVAQCQENIPSDRFFFVSGKENPSDCLSRGMLPSQLISHALWWKGPGWLNGPVSEWPIEKFSPVSGNELPESKINNFVIRAQGHSTFHNLLQKISNWDKLLRIVVYILRMGRRISADSCVQNLLSAEKMVIKFVQNYHFSEDVVALKGGNTPSKKLQKLSVFLDEEDCLRVGGRLSNSDLPFEVKHPLLLPKRDNVVTCIINDFHLKNCHAGPGLLISILRQRFWILDGRTIVRSTLRKCNICFKVGPIHPTPKMGDLPAFRVNETKAFVHTGVDYAGPIRITLSRRRGLHTQKAYICLFICLVVKAVHIELVSDLSTGAFLSAFKRFISRRGPVSCLYSDNGKNFIGAKAHLNELYNLLVSRNYNDCLLSELNSRRIEWKMIPPRAPHFGSLWESNIKSLKTHLYRVIGNQILSYEELQTVLVQIECVMNSRPLTYVTADHHPDLISPAHFLMSSPLRYLPISRFDNEGISVVRRKEMLDQMIISFWKKWRIEYLHTLQIRQKWFISGDSVKIGTVVIMGQDNLAPLHWPIGVITQVHPGNDNIVRVATVKTRTGLYKRPVMKLYPLPTQ